MTLMKMRRFPKGRLSPTRVDVPKAVSKIPPQKPKMTPKILSFVMFSFKKNEDRIRMIMGVMVTITEALIGVVNSKPFKNKSMLITTPKMAATKNFKKSFFAIFSFGNHILHSQNKSVAPATLKTTKAKGFTKLPLMTILTNVKLSPYKTCTRNTATIAKTRLSMNSFFGSVYGFSAVAYKNLIVENDNRSA